LKKGQYSKVSICVDSDTKTRYALKIYNEVCLRTPQSLDSISQEINSLQKISHENVAKIISYGLNGNISKQGCPNKNVKYLILELGERGALLELILSKKVFPVKIVRFFLKQMVQGLTALHCSNIAHRDIKLENFIVDRNFNIKYIDFGFSCEIKDNKGENVYHTRTIGTEGYMAPEFFNERKYVANKIDIFALGVCLFSMLVGYPPFAKATKSDRHYFSFFFQSVQGIKKFWSSANEKGSLIPNDAIELMNQLFLADPKSRIDLDGIKKSEFYNGEVENIEEIHRFFINE